MTPICQQYFVLFTRHDVNANKKLVKKVYRLILQNYLINSKKLIINSRINLGKRSSTLDNKIVPMILENLTLLIENIQ
jgi:hypothetical protein